LIQRLFCRIQNPQTRNIKKVGGGQVSISKVVFLFFDGFLLALDLKAAEQRVQDLDIFKSSEMIGLIQKITYNQQLLLDIRSRIRPLEKRRGLSLQAQERISETPFMHAIHIRDAIPPAHFCFSRNYHDNLENNV